MYTVATCPLCDQRYRIQRWPLPKVPRFSRVVIDLQKCRPDAYESSRLRIAR
jgi:C4-type Zn-finger protein